MFKNIMSSFLHKALYALGAMVVFILGEVIKNGPPEGSDAFSKLLWSLIAIPILTGIVAALSRWIKYDPSKNVL